MYVSACLLASVASLDLLPRLGFFAPAFGLAAGTAAALEASADAADLLADESALRLAS